MENVPGSVGPKLEQGISVSSHLPKLGQTEKLPHMDSADSLLQLVFLSFVPRQE